jgi:hypothetical protein
MPLRISDLPAATSVGTGDLLEIANVSPSLASKKITVTGFFSAVGCLVNITNATSATAYNSAALTVAGGIGAGESIRSYGTIYAGEAGGAANTIKLEHDVTRVGMNIGANNSWVNSIAGLGGVMIGRDLQNFCPNSGTSNLVIGKSLGVTANASNLVLIGMSATLGGSASSNGIVIVNGGAIGAVNDSVIIGRPDGTAATSVLVGRTANVGANGVALGHSAIATGSNSVALGKSASSGGFNFACAIGSSAVCTGANQIMLGRSNEHVVIPGTGVSTSSITGALRVAGGVGIAGALVPRGGTADASANTIIGASNAVPVTQTVIVGDLAGADAGTASRNVFIGYTAKATGDSDDAVVVGANATIGNSHNRATVIGASSLATGTAEGVVALGFGAVAGGVEGYGVSIGAYAASTRNGSVAIGGQVSSARAAAAAEQYCIAIGAGGVTGARATGQGSISIGGSEGANGASSTSAGSIAIGGQTTATAGHAIAFGTSASATAADTVAIGRTASSTVAGTIVLGAAGVHTAVSIPMTTAATSRTTGALQVGGGAGINGSVFCGTNNSLLTALNSTSVTGLTTIGTCGVNAQQNGTDTSNINAGVFGFGESRSATSGDVAIGVYGYSSAKSFANRTGSRWGIVGQVDDFNQSTAATAPMTAIQGRAASAVEANAAFYGVRGEIASTTTTTTRPLYGLYGSATAASATDTTYGAYLAASGGGTNWGLYVASGRATIIDATASASATTGALVVGGGIAAADRLAIGNATGTPASPWGRHINLSSNTGIAESAGSLVFYQNNTLRLTIANGGISTALPFSTTNATSSTSSATGALLVSGGVGIGENLYVAGYTNLGSASTISIVNSNITGATVAGYRTDGQNGSFATVYGRGERTANGGTNIGVHGHVRATGGDGTCVGLDGLAQVTNAGSIGPSSSIGVRATASTTTTTAGKISYGVLASATATGGSNAATVYGGRFAATGAATSPEAYGIYASASGAMTNWAGYFNGYVNITGTLYGSIPNGSSDDLFDFGYNGVTRVYGAQDGRLSFTTATGLTSGNFHVSMSSAWAASQSAQGLWVNIDAVTPGAGSALIVGSHDSVEKFSVMLTGLVKGAGLQIAPLAANPGNAATLWVNSGDGNKLYFGAAVVGGGSPGGADTQVQFNDGGSFGGASGFTYDKTTGTFTSTLTLDGGRAVRGAATAGIGGTALYGSINIDNTATSPGYGAYVELSSSGGTQALTGYHVVIVGDDLSGDGTTTGFYGEVYGNNGDICLGASVSARAYGAGSSIGVSGVADGIGASVVNVKGCHGEANGSGCAGTLFGVYGIATAGASTTAAYGVYGTVAGTLGANTWAGYFDGATKITGIAVTGSGRRVKYTAYAANVNLSHDVQYVGLTASGITATLWAAPTQGDVINFRNKSGTGDVSISGNGKNIDGSASNLTLPDGESIELVYDGSEWVSF